MFAAQRRRTKTSSTRKVAAQAKKLFDRGVVVTIGAHGQEEGMGSHWELWSFVRGGFSPLDALRVATIMPARKIGMEKDIGSLEDRQAG